jgi:hypothetical protein
MPNNGGYATAAYIAAAIVYVSYAISLKLRASRLRERLREASLRGDETR